jgi:hypothetical protein
MPFTTRAQREDAEVGHSVPQHAGVAAEEREEDLGQARSSALSDPAIHRFHVIPVRSTRAARSGLSAPRFWPTSAAPAVPIDCECDELERLDAVRDPDDRHGGFAEARRPSARTPI